MPRLDQATRNGTPYYNIMDHRSEISKKWKEVDQLLRFNGVLDPQLKEEVRRALSQYSGCKFCASLGEPKGEYDDVRIAAAVQFAIAVVQSPSSVSDATFAPLQEHFKAEEIVELSCWVSFMYGAELFGAIMNLDPATEPQKTAYEAWLKQGARLALASRT
ncbi:hypothetical protein J7E70_25695 [Variovorax paradoxus]|nr:hypothetical protein [Variovorax paradoxus]MBT2303843.1 hypothetical protein [Variovorax paradoxus]